MTTKAVSLNNNGASHAKYLVGAGYVDKGEGDWSFSAADGDKLLGEKGDDWQNYAQWFLGEDADAEAGTKARYKYPYGKDGKVYRSALVAIRSRAAQENLDGIFVEAGKLIDSIDGTKHYTGKKSLAMRQQAWARFEYKGMSETDTHYELKGIATTPTPDRMQDIVEPMGAQYELPLPLLWQHDAMQPIGEVYEATPTKKGIPVSFRIPKMTEPGTLKDRLDEAIQSIKMKLVRGLSIGFAPVEYSYIEESNGYRFIKWDWLELSAVTIPANAEASIANIKSFDNARKKRWPRVKLKGSRPAMDISVHKAPPSTAAEFVGRLNDQRLRKEKSDIESR